MTENQDKQAGTWAMLCHLTALATYIGIPFGNIIGPLVIWLIKKDEFPLVNDQGKESLNFQISITIYALIAGALCFVIVGFILLPALVIADIVLIILATVSASNGRAYRYPFTIRFIR